MLNFRFVFTNETNKMLLPAGIITPKGKMFKGDKINPIPGKTRKEYFYATTEKDNHQLIESEHSFTIVDNANKENINFSITIKDVMSQRQVIVYYQPLPLNNESVKEAFNNEFEITSCCKRNRNYNTLFVNIRNKPNLSILEY